MSSKTIIIEPITRVEGDVRVVLFLDEDGGVREAYYQALELRGFEAFCKGRAVEELPRISSTICGVCSWAHHVASGKALDMVFGRKPTVTASKIRELAYYLQIIDSHLLHFIVMSIPDFVVPDASPETRNIVGVLRSDPKIIVSFLKSRSLIKKLEEIFGGKPIHSAFVIPGGVSRRITRDDVEEARRLARELLGIIEYIVEYFNNRVLKSSVFEKLLYDEAYMLKTYYMGLIGRNGSLEFYDGDLRIVDPSGREYARFKPVDYTKYIAEHNVEWSYSKLPYLKPIGWKGFVEEAIVRVGPLARLNVVDKVPSEKASQEYKHMIDVLGPKPIHNTLAFHWARIIETMYSIEKFLELLDDPDIPSEDYVNMEGEPLYEGVGVLEAPRGTLIHHYTVDESYVAESVNVITPTTINNTAINTELRKVASKYVSGESVDEKLLNMVEISIRAYDPCNSCATHCIGYGGLEILLCDSKGHVLKKIRHKYGRGYTGCLR